MNLSGKELDDLLSKWPALVKMGPQAAPYPVPPSAGQVDVQNDDESQKWEERADAIVKAALAAKNQAASAAVTDALFAAPVLAAEPGEEAGGKSMSQEKEAGAEGAKSDPPAPRPSVPPAERKRQSLKEIAARASQSGARQQSSPGITPPPPSAARSESARPATATPLPRPVEAGKDDSGVINLKVVQETATAAQVAAAEKAKPAQAGLFEDEKTVESPENPAQKPAPARPSNVTVLQPKKSNAGPIAGVVIAVLGIAAAFAIVSKKPTTPAQQPAVVAEVKPSKAAAPPTTAAPTPAATAEATAVATADPTPATTGDATAKPGGEGPAKVAAGTPSGAATGAGADSPGAAQAAKGASSATGKPTDLQSAMAAAAGGTKDNKGQEVALQPTPEPASGKSQNIPEQPSQGAAMGAIGPVLGAAKACVAGADDVSRASVTFASNGTVSSVTVTGWAASNGKSGCIQAALKGAKTGPFSKPSFTVGVPIRP